MRAWRKGFLAVIILSLTPGLLRAADTEDPWIWLEEVDGEKALAWVEEQNARSVAVLEKVPQFEPIYKKSLEILNSRARIPRVSMHGKWLYNFWQDDKHVRGIWRRATLDEYRKAEPSWELILDLDALAEVEKENWVWKGANCLEPGHRLCMVSLSRGGGDATVIREFDTEKKAFVKDGFFLPEAKSGLSWRDENTLWVATDFGPGSLTTSGYPFHIKEWRRGEPMDSARLIYQGQPTDVAAASFRIANPDGIYHLVYRAPAFFRSELFLYLGDRLVKLAIPEDAQFQGIFQDRLLVSLRTPWEAGGRTYPADALLALDLDDFLRGRRDFDVLFEPEERVSLGSVSGARDFLLLTTLDNVRGRLYRLTPGEDGWSRDEVRLPGLGTVGIEAASEESNTFLLDYTDFLTPSSLYVAEGGGQPQQIKSLPAFFDATGMRTEQHEATSADGTKVPYFVVTPKGFKATGKNPTLLYGYGGFEVPMTPSYPATMGSAWLARGGVYVLANIRGGGEFGPRWHQAALKENRQRAYDDFVAVAEDLIARKITSPKHLGIMGGSNGGLLVGAAFTQRPDLFGAVVCQVPLLDMRRYNQLLAGASWMAEYGNPDVPEEWAYIQKYSPYHNLKKEASYPQVFFRTSTRDDRVHPGHARKMVARMLSMDKPVFYWENTEGGHAGAANNKQRAYGSALDYAYLWKMLR